MYKKITIVMYHYIRNLSKSRFPEIKGIEYSHFKKQIEYLNAEYTFISMEDLLHHYYSAKPLPDNTALLTFDDGYSDHYNYVFPILKKHGIKAAFYPPTKIFTSSSLLEVNKVHILLASSFPTVILTNLFELFNKYRGMEFDIPENKYLFDTYAVANRFDCKEIIFIKRILQYALPETLRKIITDELFKKLVGIDETVIANEYYMNYDQIEHLKNEGMHIGVHGHEHNWLAELNEYNMENDIKNSLKILSGIIDKTTWTICYPYNSYNKDVLLFANKKGCVAGLTANTGHADLKTQSIMELSRFDTNDFPPKSYEYKKYE